MREARAVKVMRLIEAAEVVLRDSPHPLHSAEIVSLAVSAGLIAPPKGRSPDHTLQAAIWRDLHQRRKEASPFVLIGEGRINRRYWLKGKGTAEATT